jgi:hypothetical protein
MIAPATMFISYTLLSPRNEANSPRIHNIHAVLSVCSAGLVWLFLEKTLDRPELFLPYTLAFSAHLAMAGLARLKFDYPRMPATALLTTCIVKSWLLFFAPYLFIVGVNRVTIIHIFTALLGVAFAAIAFYGTQKGMEDCPTDGSRWIRQASAAALGSTVGLAPLYLK